MSSDDEELDKLAREDLIRDMLTNNGNHCLMHNDFLT